MASPTTLARKGTAHASLGGRDKALAGHRRARPTSLAASRPSRRDAPAAFVGTLDDGLAYDTPRDAAGRPLLEGAAGVPASGHAWQVGTASWYGGPQWQGRRMSDGSRYEQDELTAAHVSLPLGSLVRVSLVGESRSVVVRITDRPGTRRRIIDLSRAAAAQLGMLSMGVAQVRLDPL